MAGKLSEGDTIGMTGEVTKVHDDGKVTVRLSSYPLMVTRHRRKCLRPHSPGHQSFLPRDG